MITRTLLLVGSMLLVGSVPAQAVQLNVHGTSDVTDSGLLSDLIVPGFQSFDPDDTIKYTAEGSGKAITTAENASNAVDAIIVHSPPLEKPFVSGGYSSEPLGRAIFFNDYVVVGPTNDPAGVMAAHRHDAVGAFEDIATAGANGTATFVTRADNSGTNTAEEVIWGQTTGIGLCQIPPTAPTTAPTGFFEPSTGPTDRSSCNTMHSTPSWYPELIDKSQGDNLDRANDCAADKFPNGGCYTLVDRGTYYHELAANRIPNLTIVSDDNASSARGGLSELTNPFHAYVVKTSANQAAATKLLDFLASAGFQASLLNYPGDGQGQVSVFPDATPRITASFIPTSTYANSSISIYATLKYAPPVAQPIAGLPVQLQSSSDGLTYADVAGATATTADDGTVSFTTTVGTDATSYRLSTPTYDDTLLQSRLTAGLLDDLGSQNGRVDVTPTPSTTSTLTTTAPAQTTTSPGETTTLATPVPTPAPRPVASDAVSVGGVSGSASGRIALKLTLPGAGKGTVLARVRRHGRLITLAIRTISSTSRKTVSVTLKPGKSGRKALAHAGRVPVLVRIRYTPTGGATRTSTSSVTVG